MIIAKDIIALLCGVSLFLFGMLLMGNGLKSVAGDKLELILYRLSNTPIKGVLLGTGVTAIIQSSSATSVMVVGFVNSGMMKVRQAIGIVLGAILGTSITGWIICLSELGGGDAGWVSLLSTSVLTGIIAIIGIILRMFSKKRIKNRVGDILMGFAILMTGMAAMSESVSFLKESPTFIKIFTSFSNPILGILAGMLITCVLQSASATVGILQVLSVTGAVNFSCAFPIIMGIAIGAAVPVLLSALGAGTEGKRTAFTYLFADIFGALFCSAVFYSLNAVFDFSIMSMKMDMVSIALLNTLFRLATVIILTPFISAMEKLVCFTFKPKKEELEDSAEIDKLEDRFIAYPAIAVEQANAAVRSMAQKSQKNLSRAFELINDYSEAKYNIILSKEEVIDRYEDKLGSYIIKLTGRDLSDEQSRQVSKILHTITDFERIGDHAVNLANAAKEIYEKKLDFSADDQSELNILVSAVSEIVLLTNDAFVRDDLEIASKVEPLEQVIDNMCDEIKLHHVRRMQSGNCTLSHGFVFNDLITNYERIADHCSNIAVAVIELHEDTFDTHEYLNEVKTNQSESFIKDFNEFDKRFTFKK